MIGTIEKLDKTVGEMTRTIIRQLKRVRRNKKLERSRFRHHATTVSIRNTGTAVKTFNLILSTFQRSTS